MMISKPKFPHKPNIARAHFAALRVSGFILTVFCFLYGTHSSAASNDFENAVGSVDTTTVRQSDPFQDSVLKLYNQKLTDLPAQPSPKAVVEAPRQAIDFTSIADKAAKLMQQKYIPPAVTEKPAAVALDSGAVAEAPQAAYVDDVVDAKIDTQSDYNSIGGNVSRLLSEKLPTLKKAQAVQPILPPAVVSGDAEPPAHTILQLQEQARIKENTYRLFSEGTRRTVAAAPSAPIVPQVAAASAPAPAPSVMTTGVAVMPPTAPAPMVSEAKPTIAPANVPAPSVAEAPPKQPEPQVVQEIARNDKNVAPVAQPVQANQTAQAAQVPQVPQATAQQEQQAAKTALAPDAAPASPNEKAEAKNVAQPVPAKPVLDVSPKTVVAAMNPGTKPPGEAADFSSAEDAAFIKKLVGSDGIISLNVSGSSAAPDVQEPVHIDEAVAFSLKNNFEVRASGEKTRGAYWDKLGAYAQYVPAIEYNNAAGSEKSSPASYNDSSGSRVLQSTHHRRDYSVSVRQPIIDLSIIADILTGGHKEDIAKADDRDVREGVASDTINVFFKLMQARIAVQLAEQYKHYLDDLASRMGARVEGGGGTNADLDRIHGRATLAESAHVEAMGEYETNLAEFKRLTKVMPAQLKIPDVLAPSIPADAQKALEAAIRSNPTYLSSLSKIDAAQSDSNKSFSNLLPKLSAQYSKVYAYDAGGAGKGNPVDGVYPTQTTESVMLVAQWALNGGTNITGGMAGLAKEREMRLRSQDILARMEQGVRAGYTAVNAARERESILRRAVDANERVVKGFEDQYKEGNRSLFDLLDSYEQLYNSRLNLMRVVIAKAQALYQIRKQMGELVPTIMESRRE